MTMHIGPAFILLSNDSRPPTPPERDKLVIEIQGLITERQLEQISPGAKPASAAVQPSARPSQPPQGTSETPEVKPDPPLARGKARPVKPAEQKPPPKIVHSPKRFPDKLLEKSAQATPSSTAAKAAASTGGGPLQQQQTISHEQRETNLIKEYLRNIRRVVQGNLIYPPEARRGGAEGIPIISFSLGADGAIQHGSLRIARSSGHPALDASALKAASASMPFARPPRPMDVSIAISFGNRGN
ncbi:energy transducer TonB [Azomonas macrocytogenes]|nr:TonB family protein [Azomonas macrocytogenes]